MGFYDPLTTRISAALWIIVAAGLVVWDIIVVTNDVATDELSNIVLFWAERTLLVPWVLGVLWGHFCIPRAEAGPYAFVLLGFSTYVMLCLGIFWRTTFGPYPRLLVLAVGALAVAAGHYWFPQSLPNPSH